MINHSLTARQNEPFLKLKTKQYFCLELTKHFQSAHAQNHICTSYLQLIDICTQLFAGELTNQNREYYKVNDNS